MAGVELDFFEIDGADMSFTQGYSDIFLVPPLSELWVMAPASDPMGTPDREPGRRVPRIEPDVSPVWPVPPERFQ